MSIYNQQQLYQLATNAGFTGVQRDTIVAIALRESGGNPDALNPTSVVQNGINYGHATGILQFLTSTFNTLTGGTGSPTNAQDSFNAAFQAYQSSGSFHDWRNYDGSVPTSPDTVLAGLSPPFVPIYQQIGGGPISNFPNTPSTNNLEPLNSVGPQTNGGNGIFTPVGNAFSTLGGFVSNVTNIPDAITNSVNTIIAKIPFFFESAGIALLGIVVIGVGIISLVGPSNVVKVATAAEEA